MTALAALAERDLRGALATAEAMDRIMRQGFPRLFGGPAAIGVATVNETELVVTARAACGPDRAMCREYGCPAIPDPVPPDEDDWARHLDAELARGRSA
jgi:hypothetical protein